MIIHDVQQGTREWLRVRLGVVTASRASDLITPKTLKRSASIKPYIHELVAETLLGEPLNDVGGGWMDRGNRVEVEARNAYAIHVMTDVRQVGFVTTDDGRLGYSPDGLVGEDGAVEIKCPKIENHIANLLEREAFLFKHRLQCQFGLMVTGRKWCDLISYCPGQKMVVERVEPDLAIIGKLRDAAKDVVEGMDAALQKIRDMDPFAHIKDGTDRAVARLFA